MNHPPDPLLAAVLDQGEAEVLTLAVEKGGLRILMDERKGRKIARTVLGLTPMGTARVLVEAKQAGLLAAVKPELERLHAAGYWLDKPIMDWALRAAGE